MAGTGGTLNRRAFLKRTAMAGLAPAALAGCATNAARKRERPPNFILVFTDDQGYNDLSCFGSKTIRTPRIDQMAAEGMKFTDFYAAAPVCSASRAALMTGSYPPRVNVPGVFFPKSRVGLGREEITIGQVLQQQGYATACVGKWHLGHFPEFLPTRRGFDYYYGIPYSNDMVPTPLMRNETVIEEPVDQDSLMERYTDEAVRFITEHRDEPFFLYMPHAMPHIPLHVSDRFRGKSEGGLYGDVIESIDWSVGEILDTLRELGLAEDTLVAFTSDNGPWLIKGDQGGSAEPLRSGKGTTFEGGMREPTVMWWPGTVPAGSVCSELASTMDFLPTFARLAGGRPPRDRIIDGQDIRPLLYGEPGAKTPYEAFFYYGGFRLEAVRSGRWKMRTPQAGLKYPDRPPGPDNPAGQQPARLYDMIADKEERFDVADEHPDVVARLTKYVERMRKDVGDSMTHNRGKNRRPPGVPLKGSRPVWEQRPA